MKTFKFVIRPMRKYPAKEGEYQDIQIFTEAPIVVYHISLQCGLDLASQHDLAKAQLKLAMIEAITNGEWTFEDS